jgi:WD40 repeat protein
LCQPIDENIKFATLNAKLFGHQKSIQCLATGFQDEEIWSCDSNGDIRVWNTETGSFVREIDSKQGRLFTMSRISDTQICTASQKSLKIWDMEKHELIKEIVGFAYCAIGVGPSLWIGCENKIAVYSLSNFSQLQEIPVQNNVVMALCWDLKRKHVWGGTTDKRKPIFVWSTETNLMVQEIDISVGHKKKVNAFALAGDRMWSAGDDSSVCVWDCQNFMLLKRLEGHEGAVYGLAWFGDFVWSCGWDTTIRLWNTQTLCLSWEIRDVHNDCVSSIQSVWNIKKKHWQAWTSSWDKSICVFALSPEHHIPLKTQGNSLKVVDDASVDFQNNTDADSNGSVKDSEVIANSNGNNSEITKISSLNIMKGIKIQKKELEERRKQLEIKKAQLEMRRLELARKKEEVDHRIQIATVERGLLEPEYNSNYEDVQKEEK